MIEESWRTMKGSIFHARLHYRLCFITLIILTTLIYSNTLDSPFLFDDAHNIEENGFIRLRSIEFKSLYEAGFKSPSSNRPLPSITFALNYYFGNYDVTGYHVVNILIHMINGFLVYALTLLLLRQQSELHPVGGIQVSQSSIQSISLLAAGIFIAHPIQTQSVTYIVQRMNSMAAMFCLTSFLLYVHARKTKKGLKRSMLFGGSVLSWVLGLGSKEIAYTLPIVVFAYEWLFNRDMRFDWIKQNLKYLLCALVTLGLVAFLYLGSHPFDRILEGYEVRDFTMVERVLTQFNVVVFYIGLLLFPHPARLNLTHQFPISQSLLEPITTLFSAALIITLVAGAFYLRRKRPLISFCILWFFINLVIESSFIGLELVFEHRLYLPMFGFALLTAFLLFKLLSNFPRWSHVLAAMIIISLGVTTFHRNSLWQDPVVFWSDALAKAPLSYRANNNLGLALKDRGRLDEALSHYKQALQLNPNSAEAHSNTGVALREKGRLDESIDHFWRAIQLAPSMADAHNNLGLILEERGNSEGAIKHYSEAVKHDPYLAEAYFNMGNALKKKGLILESIEYFGKALRLDPEMYEALVNLGNVLADQKRFKEALSHYSKALSIQPENPEIHNNIGLTLARMGDIKTAIHHFSEAVRIKPDYEDARHNLETTKKAVRNLKNETGQANFVGLGLSSPPT